MTDDDELAGLTIIDPDADPDDLDDALEDEAPHSRRLRDAAAAWLVEPALSFDEWRDREHFDAEAQTYANGKLYTIEPRPVRRGGDGWES